MLGGAPVGPGLEHPRPAVVPLPRRVDVQPVTLPRYERPRRAEHMPVDLQLEVDRTGHEPHVDPLRVHSLNDRAAQALRVGGCEPDLEVVACACREHLSSKFVGTDAAAGLA